MPRRNAVVFATVILGVVVFVAGVASYPLLFPAQKSSTAEGLPIGGYFYIDAYHPNGQLYASWQGHNSLTPDGISSLAQCLSNQSLPAFIGNCGGITASVFVSDTAFNVWSQTATNTLYPLGCNPNANPGTCTGWQAKAIIDFSTGTFPTSITRAGTYGSAGYSFDYTAVGPFTVNQGDYLTVTVVFTIS